MNPSEQHYRQLINEIRDQHITPPVHLRERFMENRPAGRPHVFFMKRWSIAASLAVVAVLAWVAVQHSRNDVLAFPDGISVEQFNGQDIQVEPVYLLDGNFSRLKQSYR